MSFINSFFENKGEHVQRLFFDIRFLFFGFTLISSLGFLIIYSFLYGYYFSGDKIFQISNFSIVSNLIPFNLQTLTITSIFFVCIYYIFSTSISLIRKNKGQKGVIVILFVLIIFLLNLAITMFFANEITVTSIVSFLLIWGFIGLIIWFLFMMPKILEHPFVTLNSVIFQFFLSIILFIVLQVMDLLEENEVSDYISVTFIPVFLSITTIFQNLYKKKWFNLISCLPYSFIISVPVIWLLKKIDILNHPKLMTWFVVTIIIHPIVLIIARFIENRWGSITKSTVSEKERNQFGEVQNQPIEEKGVAYNVIHLCYSTFSSKSDNSLKLLIGIILLGVFVSLPRLSLSCGQLIRMINQDYERQIEITYVNQSGKESNLVGNYYIENNSILYISNRCWDLEVIKPINYHIKPTDKENKQSCEKKDPTV